MSTYGVTPATRAAGFLLALCTASLVGFGPAPSHAQIAVSLGAASGGVGETVQVPVETGALDGQGVYAFSMTATHDPAQLSITGATVEGTVAAGSVLVVNTAVAGRTRIVASRATELAGSGPLVLLECQLLAGGTASLQWQDFAFDGTAAPAVTLTPGRVAVEGEVVVNRLVNGGPAAADLVELVVLEDGLDLRGYQVQDPGTGTGIQFADNALWHSLPRGTVVVAAGGQAGTVQDLDLADGRIVVGPDAAAAGLLLTGGLPDLAGDAGALQVLRPGGEQAFGVVWGSGPALAGRHANLAAPRSCSRRTSGLCWQLRATCQCRGTARGTRRGSPSSGSAPRTEWGSPCPRRWSLPSASRCACRCRWGT
ncbi:MAG: cohesin domain-containing protein [Candidatus Latescibacterota bacterium]